MIDRERIDFYKAAWPDIETRFAPPDPTICRRFASTPLAPPPQEELTHVNCTGHTASHINLVPQHEANRARQEAARRRGRPEHPIMLCPKHEDGKHRWLVKSATRFRCPDCTRVAAKWRVPKSEWPRPRVKLREAA